MNLARVLEQSAEDLPPVHLRLGPPRLHPQLVVRQHREAEGTVYKALIPGGRPPHYFRFSEIQWKICQLFDGQRTPEMVVPLAERRYGVRLRLDDVQKFVDMLERDEFWHRTPQEESVALCQQLLDKRHLREKKDYGDLSHIVLAHFDPDRFLTWCYRHFKWVYSRWFSVWSVFMLLVMFVILGSHWRQVWSDSVDYYRLTSRGFGHFLLFLGVFVILGTVHETCHGLTCKHFGGEVHRMGANLVYLAPCVFCDISQVWVYGGRRERMLTVFAGVWSEIVLCTYASVIWWATPPGTLHQAAYLTILAGGIFCVMMNWNPLSKMDGYMLLTEYFRTRDVKVVATNWLVSWVRKNIFRLPATVQVLSRRRSIAYAVYALLAGAYSYFLLLFFARVLYSILHYYMPQWAFVPAGLLAFRIFRSRIRKLVHFMKELYQDKKHILQAHRRILITGTVALFFLGWLPLRRETVQEKFLLEPVQRTVLRAQVPGVVVEIAADEGQAVAVGAVLARMRDLTVQSKTARAAADYETAGARAIDAQLRYADFATVRQKLYETETDYQVARDRQLQLTIVSPIPGIVVTPRVRDLLGTFIKEGTVVAEVADVSSVRARIFVPDSEMHKLQHIHDVSLRMDSEWVPVQGKVISISPTSQPPSEGLVAAPEYKGVQLPEYFVVTVGVTNRDGRWRDGLTGTAKIHGDRRSVFGMLLEPVVAAAARRVW